MFFRRKQPTIAPARMCRVHCQLLWVSTLDISIRKQDFSWDMPRDAAEDFAQQLILSRHALRKDRGTGQAIAEAKINYPPHPLQEVASDIWLEELK